MWTTLIFLYWTELAVADKAIRMKTVFKCASHSTINITFVYYLAEDKIMLQLANKVTTIMSISQKLGAYKTSPNEQEQLINPKRG